MLSVDITNFDLRMKNLLLSLLLLLGCFSAFASQPPTDSVKAAKKQKTYAMKLTTRIHSMGLFSYAGRLVSDNPALDFNFAYDRKEFGFMFYKAFDLYDCHSDNNFSLALLYHHFKLGNRWTFTPGVGFVIDQTHNIIANKGSDASVIITTAFKVNSSLTIDHSSVTPNMIIESGDRDWINRLRFLYSKSHLDVGLTVWHNNKVFDHTEYLTTGLNITYARIPINDHIFINTGITGVLMPYSNDEEAYPKRNGIVFTLAAVVH